MGLDTGERKQAIYFVGTEIENTVMKGERTLFVVGVRPVEEIRQLVDRRGIKHIYFGTSQSFIIDREHPVQPWIDMMQGLLEKDYWVTLDFGIEYMDIVNKSGLMEYSKFVPMISAKIPSFDQVNSNATLKIDDTTWGHSNTGVWSKNLKELTTQMHYTDWSEYVGDTVIDLDEVE